MAILRMLRESPVSFLGWFLAFMLAIMLHELAHGYIAMKNGDNTAKYMGRMNLNPAKHFDLIGTLMFLFIGFGYAKPVPIDPRNFRSYKKGMVQVSLAGVTTNFILAFFCYPLFVLAATFLPDMLLFDEFISAFLFYMVQINLILMVFNLLPIYPLDGFRLLETVSKPNRFFTFMRERSLLILLAFILISNFIPIIGTFYGWVVTPIQWFWNLILGLLGL